MPFRVDVTADGWIEIMRPVASGEHHHLKYESKESALRVMAHFLDLDLLQALEDRFEPQIYREAKKAFEEMERKSPYGKS